MSHNPIHSGTKVLDVQMSGDKIRFTVMFVSLSETGQRPVYEQKTAEFVTPSSEG